MLLPTKEIIHFLLHGTTQETFRDFVDEEACLEGLKLGGECMAFSSVEHVGETVASVAGVNSLSGFKLFIFRRSSF